MTGRTRADRIGAAGVAIAALAVSFGAGWAVRGATAPEPPSSSYSTASSVYGGGSTSPSASPSPSPTPVVYGATGLAGQYARQLGHDSMSAACAAGVELACGVTAIEPSGEYVTPGGRTVYTTTPPMDGDQAAAEWLAMSPPTVTSITITDRSGILAQNVGTATREGTR